MRRLPTGHVAPLLIVVALLAPGARAAAPAGPTTRGATGHGSAAHPARRAAPGLPDSVLAQVGAHRRISVTDYRRAWREVPPPSRPDSLTPTSAREFLQLLVGKEALAEAALKESWVWTRAESARFISTRDRLVMGAALEVPLADARADLERAGQPADDQAAGAAARDSAAVRMGATFDEAVLERLTRAFAAVPKPSRDSGLFAQLRVLGTNPVVGPRDSLAVIARTNEGEYRVSDLLAWWANLNPLARPRIETAGQMRDVVKNGLFERKLRRLAATLGLEQRPDIAAELDRQREFIAVSHLVQREVYDSLDADSITLRRFFDRRPEDYALPLRLRVLRLELSGRDDAARMAVRLRDPAQAESLAAMAERQRLGYVSEISATTDSALFAEGLRAGPGAVVGPDSTGAGWGVARIEAVLPGRLRSFEEARKLVEHQWYGVEGERRMTELIARLRKRTTVVTNERALARLTVP